MSRSTPAPPPRLMTVAQAAEHLGTTTSKLYELVASRAIRSVRISRAIRIPQDNLDRLTADVCRNLATPGADNQRSSHQRPDPREHLDQPDHAPDQGSSSPTHQRPTSDPVPIPDRRHSEQQPSEPRQPNSRETRNRSTDLHPRATRQRVDAESPREARS